MVKELVIKMNEVDYFFLLIIVSVNVDVIYVIKFVVFLRYLFFIILGDLVILILVVGWIFVVG